MKKQKTSETCHREIFERIEKESAKKVELLRMQVMDNRSLAGKIKDLHGEVETTLEIADSL